MAKEPRSSKADEEARLWRGLLARAETLDAPLNAEEFALWQRGVIDGNSRMWNVEYVHAVQRAVHGHDRAELDAMLRAEIPIPPFLLPYLADATQGRRPAAFTAAEDKANARLFERYTKHFDMTPVEARRRIAAARGVETKTVARSITRARRAD